MIQINNVEWGKIEVNSEEYRQVLIVGEDILERDSEKLRELFKTTHRIGNWEVEKLLSDQPEVIVIGNGFDGILEVSEELKEKCQKLGIELKILKTPWAVKEFNRLSAKGLKVNALIHTTC